MMIIESIFRKKNPERSKIKTELLRKCKRLWQTKEVEDRASQSQHY